MKCWNRCRARDVMAAASLSIAATLPLSVSAQDYNAMIQQGMNRMNQIVANAQQQANNIVHQRMHDPQVQASYQQYLAQRRAYGQPAMDYPTYTYNYRALLGQSTYRAENGAPVVLPHTWQSNTTHEFQGNTYHVNESGQYFVRRNDGWWYPVGR